MNTVTVSGAHGFSIEQLNIKQPGPGQTDPKNAWQSTATDLNDPENLGIGDINYWVAVGGVGAVDQFIQKSATRIPTRRIGSAP